MEKYPMKEKARKRERQSQERDRDTHTHIYKEPNLKSKMYEGWVEVSLMLFCCLSCSAMLLLNSAMLRCSSRISTFRLISASRALYQGRRWREREREKERV